jgi:hypothetical protein
LHAFGLAIRACDGKLLGNALVVRYLAQHHGDILTEFQKLAEMESAAA